MIGRRHTDLVRKAVAMVALIGCLLIGVAITGSVWIVISGNQVRLPWARNTTTAVTPPPENIRPIQVRPVQEALVATAEQCPREGPPPVAAPSDILSACDFKNTATYALGAQVMELQLTHVETAKSPMSQSDVVRLTMQWSSAAAFSTYTAGHVGEQLAFVRDGIVVFAPKITQQINSATLEISGDLTEEEADDVARLLRQGA
jgi:hypothetical protein